MLTPDDAKPDGCQEESLYSPIPQMYLPCNLPAVRLVYHSREDRTYRMCAMCADHNLKNRGGEDRGPYPATDFTAVEERTTQYLAEKEAEE